MRHTLLQSNLPIIQPTNPKIRVAVPLYGCWRGFTLLLNTIWLHKYMTPLAKLNSNKEILSKTWRSSIYRSFKMEQICLWLCVIRVLRLLNCIIRLHIYKSALATYGGIIDLSSLPSFWGSTMLCQSFYSMVNRRLTVSQCSILTLWLNRQKASTKT